MSRALRENCLTEGVLMVSSPTERIRGGSENAGKIQTRITPNTDSFYTV